MPNQNESQIRNTTLKIVVVTLEEQLKVITDIGELSVEQTVWVRGAQAMIEIVRAMVKEDE